MAQGEVILLEVLQLYVCHTFAIAECDLLGGLLYYPGDSDEASLNPALNAAMLLMRYADSGLPSTSSKHSAYIEFAQNQVDYVLGNNPMTGAHFLRLSHPP